jgi:hypothetical protein
MHPSRLTATRNKKQNTRNKKQNQETKSRKGAPPLADKAICDTEFMNDFGFAKGFPLETFPIRPLSIRYDVSCA